MRVMGDYDDGYILMTMTVVTQGGPSWSHSFPSMHIADQNYISAPNCIKQYQFSFTISTVSRVARFVVPYIMVAL